MVRPAAGLEADRAARQIGEEGQDLGPRQPLAQHRLAVSIDAVHLEYVLGDVETDRGNLHPDVSLRGCGQHHIGTSMPREASISLSARGKIRGGVTMWRSWVSLMLS
jgi:hypothetical protein